MAEQFKHLTEDGFDQEIKSGLILVDFYADWCGPCRMLTPILEKVAKDFNGKATVAKLDIDKAQKTASSFQITSIPTLILFRNGKEVGRLVGLRDEKTIKDLISSGQK
ncbi:MAG TPA: thioredoxin [Rhabdochlamydiaceae bacterium]|nr:thioredoxin [Rhabdochlamydiaceae bacterium]